MKVAAFLLILVLAVTVWVVGVGANNTQYLDPIYVLTYNDQNVPVWSFEVGGQTYVYMDGNLTQICPCSCPDRGPGIPVATATLESTEDTPVPSETPAATVTSLASTSTPQATRVVDPNKTPKPTHTDKPDCNSGVGNGSEGCDPGNSDHNGSNDEGEDDEPGNPGHRGGPNR